MLIGSMTKAATSRLLNIFSTLTAALPSTGASDYLPNLRFRRIRIDLTVADTVAGALMNLMKWLCAALAGTREHNRRHARESDLT
jgi:hypothetical protein